MPMRARPNWLIMLLPILLLAFGGSRAAEEETEDIPPEQRLAPGKGEPEVRIIQRPDVTIEEYRSGGRVYMIKVIPEAGPAYYLYDRDGDGLWDERLGPDITAPQWTIFEW